MRGSAGPKACNDINQECHHRECTHYPPGAHENVGNSKQKAVEEEEGKFDEIYNDPEE